jgi:hypothetical protein
MARSKKPVEACEPSSSNSDEDNSTSTENKSLSKGKSGSTRKMTDIGAVCKAKWLFYNDNKNNKNIVDDWVQKRKVAGLPYQKPKVVSKQVIMVLDVNFLDIKATTDDMWEKLNAKEQKKYIDKAWVKHNAKTSKDNV